MYICAIESSPKSSLDGSPDDPLLLVSTDTGQGWVSQLHVPIFHHLTKSYPTGTLYRRRLPVSRLLAVTPRTEVVSANEALVENRLYDSASTAPPLGEHVGAPLLQT